MQSRKAPKGASSLAYHLEGPNVSSVPRNAKFQQLTQMVRK
jgi:hypothetical protein